MSGAAFLTVEMSPKVAAKLCISTKLKGKNQSTEHGLRAIVRIACNKREIS